MARQMMGALFVDGLYANNPLCGSDGPLHMDDMAGATITYSSCVVQRVLAATGLGGQYTIRRTPELLTTRSFSESLR